MKLTLEQAKSYYTLACDAGPVYHLEDEWDEIWKEMQVLCDAKTDQEAAKTIEWWRVWCGDYTAVSFARKVRQAYREEHGITESATPLLGQREQELLNYLSQQFPATVGHIPLAEKIHAVWRTGWQSGMTSAADIVLSRAEQLQRNGCKDTIREHYAEQAIRSAAWPNATSSPTAAGAESGAGRKP